MLCSVTLFYAVFISPALLGDVEHCDALCSGVLGVLYRVVLCILCFAMVCAYTCYGAL